MNPYVPWNTSLMGYLRTAIGMAIGNAVNIGIAIFAIILGIYVVIRVVKKFTRG